VEETVRKHSRILSSIAVAAVFLGASPASADHGTPVYGTTYFTDATLTTQAGYMYLIGCDGDNGQFMLDGQATNYSTNYLAGYCHDGVMEPI
jgi:hypothetical protein